MNLPKKENQFNHKNQITMTIAENNKLIAEFMGVIPTSSKHTKYWYDGRGLAEAGLPFACGAMGNGTGEPKFHTSWDWLMPVVETIEAKGYGVLITPTGCNIIVKTKGFVSLKKPKIEAAYEAIIAFVKWYNENK